MYPSVTFLAMLVALHLTGKGAKVSHGTVKEGVNGYVQIKVICFGAGWLPFKLKEAVFG